jgi:type IV pilus assembly protein PilQ
MEQTTLPPVSTAPVVVKAITVSEETGSTRIIVEGSDELVYGALELDEDPLKIRLEIPKASIEVVTPIPVNNGTLTEIIATSYGDGGRLEIGLVDRVPFNLTREANNIYIDVERPQEFEGAKIEATAPAVVEEIETTLPMKPATAMTDLKIAGDNEATTVAIIADGAIGDYNSFILQSPPRVVIDLWELRKAFPEHAVHAGTRHLRRIRIGEHPKKTRLVFDITGSELPGFRVDRFENELVVLLGSIEAAAPHTGNRLSGIDFKQINGKSRVVLSSSHRLDYEVFKASQKEVVVDLKKTTSPHHLKRTLNTRAFDSAIEAVRLYNVKSENSKDVRVIIYLRDAADFEVFQEGPRIFVDFARPSSVETADPKRKSLGVIARPGDRQDDAAALEGQSQANTEEETVGTDVTPQPNLPEPLALATGEGEPNPEAPSEVEASFEGSDAVPATGTGMEIGEVAPPKTVKEPASYELALRPGKIYSGRRLSLDFKDAEIKNILRLIAEVSNLNIVAGDDVKGKVTIRLIDVPWDQALDIILFSNNLGKMRMGNVIRVAPVEVLKREEEELLSAKRTKEKLEDLVTELIPINYSTAQELSPQVENILSERGTISIDGRTNTLIIKDIRKNVAEAKTLVRQLDARTPQVVIEARFVEASTNFSRELGIQWGGKLDDAQIGGESSTVDVKGGLGTTTNVADIAANFAVGQPTSAITFNLMNLGDIANLDIELSALETAGDGEIISAPRITTSDNKEASIEQGLRIPYLKLTAEGTATTEFVEANIKLSVTPHVTNDGHIKMNIKASKDAPDFTQGVAIQGGIVPAIDKKEAITEVLVEDNDVIVIGGIYSIDKSDSVDRVPVLGKIPILGYLFKKTTRSDDRRDLLIFISPRIIDEVV